MLTIGQQYQLTSGSITITRNLTSADRTGHELYRVTAASGQTRLLKCATTARAVALSQREFNILTRLKSVPAIPQCVAAQTVSGAAWGDIRFIELIEYVEPAAHLINFLELQPTLSEQVELLSDVVFADTQLVQILAAVHDLGILHGDLKWQNVLLDKAHQIHLIDWDHARWLQRGDDAASTLAGTPQYLAPEYLLGQPIDQRADIYTLGLMSLAMVYGSRLTPRYGYSHGQWQRRGPAEITMAIAQGETAKYQLLPSPRSQLELNCQAIWQRMTQADPTKRFATMVEVEQALQQAI